MTPKSAGSRPRASAKPSRKRSESLAGLQTADSGYGDAIGKRRIDERFLQFLIEVRQIDYVGHD